MDGHLVDMARAALRYAETSIPGAAYCDARAEEHEAVSIRVENGKTQYSRTASSSGVGIRMLAGDGTWRFASVSSPKSAGEVRDTIDAAAKVAGDDGSCASPGRSGAALYDAEPHTDKVACHIRDRPSHEGITKIGHECCDAIMAGSPDVTNSVASPQYDEVSKYFASSEGADILQSHADTILSMSATAASPGGTTRTIDTTVGGRGGLEMISDVFPREAARISEAAPKLASARAAGFAAGADVIMDPGFVALLVHEIVGHPSEADRVLGREMAWAGGAWWGGRQGQKIASDALGVFDDPTINGTLGSYRYDDEGTKASRTALISGGVLKGHMHSRETAQVFDGAAPTGNMRAAGHGFMPLIRMACTCIEPGDHNPEEMVRDVEDGYAVYGMRVPSIDMQRYNWSISCQYARRITGGELGEVLRDVIVSGTAPDFFSSISACGRDFAITPITNCGKGDPMQSMMMGNGGPTIRARANIGGVGSGRGRTGGGRVAY